MIGIHLVDFFRGTNSVEIYQNELAHSQFWSRESIQEIQWRRMEKLLNHAYKKIPYYRRLFDELGIKPNNIQHPDDLIKIPTLTKEIIRRNFNDLLSEDFRTRKPRKISTGGSTGQPLQFFIDSQTNGYQWADAYRGQIIGGWNFGNKIGRIWGSSLFSISNKIVKSIYGYLNNWELFPAFDSNENQMRNWINIIRKNKIRFLAGYVDTIVDFSRFIIANNLNTHLIAIYPTTAPLTFSGRQIISKAFGCGIFDLYQSADGGLSSHECHEHKGLHIAEERCFIEVPEIKGEHNIPVIVTDLFNYSMPFIRYENGDEIVVSNDICNCGRESKVIKYVSGKTYHHIHLPNGKVIHSEIFSYHLNRFLCVKHFCAKQISADEINLEIVLDRNYSNEDRLLDESIKGLLSFLPGIRVNTIFVDEIMKMPNQKYQLFIPFENKLEEKTNGN